MKISATSFLLKNVLLHEKKLDIGNGVEPSGQIFCPEGSTRWPSTQYFRSILQVNYHLIQPFKRSTLAFEMAPSGLITEHGERADAAGEVSLSHTPYA